MTMAHYRRTPEVERKYVRLELADGWVRVLARIVLLMVAIVAASVLLICAMHGGQWVAGLTSASTVAAIRSLMKQPGG